MKGPQESTPEGGEIEAVKAANGRGPVRGLLGWAHTMLLGAGVVAGGAGCSGEKPEAPKPPLDVCVTMVTPVEKARPPEGGVGVEAKKEEKKKKEKKEEIIETRRVAVIGQGHVKVDGRYYLKTKDWDKETVWMLHKGYRLPVLDTPPEISAEFKGKNMKYAGRYYSEAEDPAAWEKGVEADKSPSPKTEITPPMPVPKPAEEKIVPLTTTELSKPLVGHMTVMGNQLTVFDGEGKYHVFSLYAGPPYPHWSAPFAGVLYVDPKGTRGERRILLNVGWSTIPGPRGIVRIPPTAWQWLETGPVKK